eukprot:9488497-Alexandrium_andersonii.AAC.1
MAVGSKTRTSTVSTKPTWTSPVEPMRLGAAGLLSAKRCLTGGRMLTARRPLWAARRFAAADLGNAGSGTGTWRSSSAPGASVETPSCGKELGA